MAREELEILSDKAQSKTAKKFLLWLRQRRPKAIHGERRSKFKNKGAPFNVPYFKNPRAMTIETEEQYDLAGDLCNQIVRFSTDKKNPFDPSDTKILLGILNRVIEESQNFCTSKGNYQFFEYKADFLDSINRKDAAKFVLQTLKNLDVPYNENSSGLYQMLLGYDKFYFGEDRFEQRRLLSLTYRDLTLPPFFADDGVFVIFNRKKIPYTNITPADIEVLIQNKTSHTELHDWECVITEISRDKGGNATGFSIRFRHTSKSQEIGSSLAIILRTLLKPEYLKDGVSRAEMWRYVGGAKKSIDTSIGRLIKKLTCPIKTGDNRDYIDPDIKILLIKPKKVKNS